MLQSVEATPKLLTTLTPPATINGCQRLLFCIVKHRNVLTVPRCQQTSLAGIASSALSHFVLPSWNPRFASTRQARHRVIAYPPRASPSPCGRSRTSYQLEIPSSHGKPSEDTTHSLPPEGFRSRAISSPSVTLGVHHRNVIPPSSDRSGEPEQLGSCGSRAPEANIYRRSLLTTWSLRDHSRNHRARVQHHTDNPFRRAGP